jgi:hypothetical protein
LQPLDRPEGLLEMPSAKQPNPGHRAVQGSFLVGLALIVFATVHNVGFDGMTKAERLTLPSYLADSYAKYGKLGVTLFFVALGIVVMLTGLLIQYLCTPRQRTDGWVAPKGLAPNPAWRGSDQNGGPIGRVVLDTQKYLD